MSLTSQMCKIMDVLVCDSILQHVDSKGLFSIDQHGFTGGKLYFSNLLETLEIWTSAVEEGNGVDVIYLDYQKAFDTVPIKRLIQKLKGHGVRGVVAKWLEDLLTGRNMRVGVRGSYSEWVDATSGVPQGSVIGTLLFLLYVNDIPESLQCMVKMFADDTKVFNKVKTTDDCDKLQEVINWLSDEWSRDWMLKFNTNKCKRMCIGRRNRRYTYRMVEETLEEAEEEKDLGVWMKNNLKPEKQVATAFNKAMATLRSICRSFVNYDKETFHITYRTYVRPHLVC